jgi:hypothetical protein
MPMYISTKQTESTVTVQCFLFAVEARKLNKLKIELNEVAYLGLKITRSWNSGQTADLVEHLWTDTLLVLAMSWLECSKTI